MRMVSIVCISAPHTFNLSIDEDRPPERQDPPSPHGGPESDLVGTSGAGDTAPAPFHEPDITPPTASQNATSSHPDNKPAHPWPTAPLAPGVDSRTAKTANKAYDTVTANMLNEAQHRFETKLFIENAYPDLETQVRWSMECWESACGEYKTYYELSKDMRSLVSDKP